MLLRGVFCPPFPSSCLALFCASSPLLFSHQWSLLSLLVFLVWLCWAAWSCFYLWLDVWVWKGRSCMGWSAEFLSLILFSVYIFAGSVCLLFFFLIPRGWLTGIWMVDG